MRARGILKRDRDLKRKSSHLKDTILYNFFKKSEKISNKTTRTARTQYIVLLWYDKRKSFSAK